MENIKLIIEQYFSENLHRNELEFVRGLGISVVDSDIINFNTTNPLFRQWFQEHHRKKIEQLVEKNYAFAFEMINTSINVPRKQKKLSLNFNPRFQFKSFLHGDSNQEALGVLKSLSDDVFSNLKNIEGKYYFLHGPKGSGKTHLLSAFLFKLHKNFDDCEVVFMKTKDFLSSFVFACREGNRNEFFDSFKNKKIFVLEGIDLLLEGDKSKTQMELTEILDHYITQGRSTVILSAENIPLGEKYIPALWSKLCGAEFLPIGSLDRQLAENIITEYQQNHRLNLDVQALEYLKNQEFENYNYLLASLANIKYHFKSKLVTLEKIQEVFVKSGASQNSNISDKNILKVVSDYLEVPSAEIVGKGQKQEITRARHIFIYLCRELNSSTFDSIANLIKRDHSTVQNAYKKIKGKKDGVLQLTISQIKSKVIKYQ